MKLNKYTLSMILCILVIETFGQLKPEPAIKQKTLDIQYLKNLPISTSQTNDTSSTFSIMSSGSRLYAQGHAFVQINGTATSHLTQLDYKDTLIGSTVQHFTTIVARISATSFLDIITKNLNQSTRSADTYSMTTILTNFNYENIEQRDYSESFTRNITIPPLNKSERTPFELVINIQSNTVNTENNIGSRTGALQPKAKLAFCNNFRFSLGNLITNRISSISSISIQKIKTANSRNDSISISDFTIEIPQADAGLWNDWFESPNRATDLKDGEITILGVDQKQVLMSIQLRNVEIISYSASAGASTSSKRIGLRAKDISMQMKIK